MLLPKIIIRYGFLLDPKFREYFLLELENKDKILIENEELFKNIEDYKKEWKKHEDKILEALLNLLPIKFIHNVIDVYVVSYLPGNSGISEPLIISGDLKTDRFIDVLVHEIIHVYLTNNNIIPKIFPFKIIDAMFPEEKDLKVKSHIIVHAIQKYILLDILKDNNRYINNKEKFCLTESYKKSWDIVEERGYIEIINEFKNRIELSLKNKK